jgi:hypothetical protein
MLSLALNFVNEHRSVDRLVVGVNSVDHVREISHSVNSPSIQFDPNQIAAVSDLRLIDPRQWRIS